MKKLTIYGNVKKWEGHPKIVTIKKWEGQREYVLWTEEVYKHVDVIMENKYHKFFWDINRKEVVDIKQDKLVN